MDHQFIDENNIRDRYLIGTLGPEDRQRFEEHFLFCDECLSEMDTIDDFRVGLRGAAMEDLTRGSALAKAGILGRLIRRRTTAVICAMVLSISLLLAAYIRERREAAGYRKGTAELENRFEVLQKSSSELENRYHELERKTSEPAQSKTTQAPALIPIFIVDTVRTANQTQKVNRIIIPRTAPFFALSPELANEPGIHVYRAEIITSDHQNLLTIPDLKPSPDGMQGLTLPTALFKSGNYLLKIEGFSQKGALLSVNQYPFHLVIR